ARQSKCAHDQAADRGGNGRNCGMVDGQEPPCAPAPARALRLYCGKKSQHQGWDVEAQRRTANDLRQGKSLASRDDQGRAQNRRKAGRLKCCQMTSSDVKSKLPPTFKARATSLI